jgi:type II secretory pathway component GspD/PulD (secretin)
MMVASLVLAAMLQDSDRLAAENKLRNMKVSLEYKGADLRDVIQYLQEMTEINFFLSKQTQEMGELQVTITVKNISVKSALNLILKPLKLTTLWQDGVMMITTPAEEPVLMEIYDVRDLMHPLKDMPGVEIDFGTGTVVQPESVDAAVLPLEELVKAHTGGKSWDDNPKCTISLQNGILVVKQTREVHKQIRRIIGQLRQYK